MGQRRTRHWYICTTLLLSACAATPPTAPQPRWIDPAIMAPTACPIHATIRTERMAACEFETCRDVDGDLIAIRGIRDGVRCSALVA